MKKDNYLSPLTYIIDLSMGKTVLYGSVHSTKPDYDDIILDEWED